MYIYIQAVTTSSLSSSCWISLILVRSNCHCDITVVEYVKDAVLKRQYMRDTHIAVNNIDSVNFFYLRITTNFYDYHQYHHHPYHNHHHRYHHPHPYHHYHHHHHHYSAKTAADGLSSTILMFEAFHDVELKAANGR